MNTKHTSGEWHVSKHGTPDYAPQFGIYADDGRDLAIVVGDNSKANAALIVSAPALLAALEEAERVLRWAVQEARGKVRKEIVGGWAHHANLARRAIASAEGRA